MPYIFVYFDRRQISIRQHNVELYATFCKEISAGHDYRVQINTNRLANLNDGLGTADPGRLRWLNYICSIFRKY